MKQEIEELLTKWEKQKTIANNSFIQDYIYEKDFESANYHKGQMEAIDFCITELKELVSK